MPTKILITGGCGFVGTNLISFLNKSGDTEIVVLDNESLGKREHLDGLEHIEFINGDIRDEEAVQQALKGVDSVIHLAADTRVIDSIEDPVHNFNANVCGTFNLLCQMRKAGVSKIINASTGGAILGEVEPPVHEGMLPEPAAPYGASKLAIEGYLSAFSQSYDFHAVSLRFSNIYGQRSWHKGSVVAHFFKSILKGDPLVVYGDGSQKRDYIFIEDICKGIIQSLEAQTSGTFQLGTGIPTTINELIEQMKAVVGPDYPVTVKYEDFRQGELLHTWSDISKAQDTLNFAPKVSLRDGLERTWAWFLRNWPASR